MTDNVCKEEMTAKFMALFENEPANFAIIIMILSEEENKFVEALWRSLKVAKDNPIMFAKLANAIVDGITPPNEEKYQKMMESIEAVLLSSDESSIEVIEETHNNILQEKGDEIEMEGLDELPVESLKEILGDSNEETEENDEEISEQEVKTQKIQLALLNAKKRNDVIALYGMSGMAAAWALARGGLQSHLAQVFFGIFKNNYFNLFSSADEVVGFISSNAAAITMGAVAAAMLTYCIFVNINRWYKGEISGKRCSKNIVDNILAVGGSCAGGIVGSIALGGFGPFGVAVGGIAGGILGAKAAKFLSQRLTKWLFGLPQSEALENAYRFFGVNLNATNHEINQAFRKQCLKHHPDKGGKPEDFHFIKINMELIRQSKGYQMNLKQFNLIKTD